MEAADKRLQDAEERRHSDIEAADKRLRDAEERADKWVVQRFGEMGEHGPHGLLGN
jgi:hypothetical protein